MKSHLEFFQSLTSSGLPVAEALKQYRNWIRIPENDNLPLQIETDDSGTGKSKLDAVVSLYRKDGLRGRQFREAISKVPGDTPFKNQQEIYDAIAKAGLEDGSPEFADAFMTLGGDHLPLKTK